MSPAASNRFTAFSLLWCLAILVHQLYQGRFVLADPTALVTFAALWAILRPGSVSRLATLAAAHFIVVVWELPVVVNHWLLMGVTSLGLLVTLLPALRGGRREEARLEELLVPVRAQIIVVYVFATLAKLNAGFFDPELSCGADHYRRLARSVPLLPTAPWAITAGIYGTLVIEAALPLLLVARRTRVLALLLGWGFHLLLGWNGYWDFSTVATAYYATFLPERCFGAWRLALERRPRLGRLLERTRVAAHSPWAFPAAAALLTGLLLLARLPPIEPHALAAGSHHAGRVLWLVVWLCLGGVLALGLFGPIPGERPGRDPGWRPLLRPALLLAPALVLLNGFSPFLGLKTENSYTMFSNVRTEGDVWNHYVFPRGMRTFGFQDELVNILGSSDPALEPFAARGWQMVPFALRRWAQQHPDASLAYRWNSEVRRAKPVADDPWLSEPLNPLLAKLFLFRPVPPRPFCVH